MTSIKFTIPAQTEEYHVPLLNIEQMNRLVDISPRFIALISDEKFDFSNEENILTAFLQLVTTGSIFKKLAATLICPASRDYYIEADPENNEAGDFERNMKFVSRIPITYLIEGDTDETGKVILKPGVLLQSFLASNSNWCAPIGSLLSLWKSEVVSPEEEEVSSQDIPPEDGTTLTGFSSPSSERNE